MTNTKVLRIAMNGITGRMGYRQHLLRSILPIRDQGGITLADGTKLTVEPILVGRNEDKLRELAQKHQVEHYSTDLDSLIEDPSIDIIFDASMTSLRYDTLSKAIAAGKHVFTEKPTAENLDDAVDLARQAKAQGITAGVVHDKLYLPGLVKLRRLVDEGFFGRILSLRGEFGYWVFEGDIQEAQRPSWNYRLADGGSMTTDMYCHWNYVLEGIIGQVKTVTSTTATHIPTRWDEQGEPTPLTASLNSKPPKAIQSSHRSTPRGLCAYTATNSSNSRSMEPMVQPWQASTSASPSSALTRLSRYGTQICQ